MRFIVFVAHISIERCSPSHVAQGVLGYVIAWHHELLFLFLLLARAALAVFVAVAAHFCVICCGMSAAALAGHSQRGDGQAATVAQCVWLAAAHATVGAWTPANH